MKIKLKFGDGFVIPDYIYSIDCPNAHGGIGDIVFNARSEGLWSGEAHFYSERMRVHFGDVVEIQTRNNLNGTNEEWKTIWKSPKLFTYAAWIKAAQLIWGIYERNHYYL